MIKLAKNIEQACHNVLLLEEPQEVDKMQEVARLMESAVTKRDLNTARRKMKLMQAAPEM